MVDIVNAGVIALVASVMLVAVGGGAHQLRDDSHATSLAGADDAAAVEASPEARDVGPVLEKPLADADDHKHGHRGDDDGKRRHHDKDEDDEEDDG